MLFLYGKYGDILMLSQAEIVSLELKKETTCLICKIQSLKLFLMTVSKAVIVSL